MAFIQRRSRVGIDPHEDTLAASGIDAVGLEVFHLEVPNTSEGTGQLVSHVNGAPVLWGGVEGTGIFGRTRCDRLLAEDRDVVEVRATPLTGRYRTPAGRNKADRGDAVAIAQASLVDESRLVVERPDPCHTTRIIRQDPNRDSKQCPGTAPWTRPGNCRDTQTVPRPESVPGPHEPGS